MAERMRLRTTLVGGRAYADISDLVAWAAQAEVHAVTADDQGAARQLRELQAKLADLSRGTYMAARAQVPSGE